MNTLYLFDVDGVLCDRGQKVDDQFKIWFLSWAENKSFFFITGSDRNKTIEQLGNDFVQKSKISYHCMGNNIWINNKEISINQFFLKKDELEFLENAIQESVFPLKTGNHMDFRKGSVNFSVIGKNASITERQQYKKFDKISNERLKIVKQLTTKFPRLDAYLGGDISIDICLKGADKSQVLQILPPHEKLIFFGDRCYPYGIDYPISKYFTPMTKESIQGTDRYRHEYFQINNGYNETWEILKLL
jgi:phosphomannomutase